MKRAKIAEFIAYLFIILFLYTAVSKLMEYSVFEEQIEDSPILGPIAPVVVWLLPLSEFVVSILLFIPNFRLKGFYLSVILMVIFTGYVISILTFGQDLPCSCGGILKALSWPAHLIFNTAFVVLGIIGIKMLKGTIPILKKIGVNFKSAVVRNTPMMLLIAISLSSIFSGCSEKRTKKTGLEGKPLPSFNVLLQDSSGYYNTDNLHPGKPIVLFFYSPRCPYCKAQMKEFTRNIDRFKDMQIFLVTSYPYKEMKNFYSDFGINKYPNIVAGRDTAFFVNDYFESNTVPLTALYDKDRKLKNVFFGRVFSKDIMRAAEN